MWKRFFHSIILKKILHTMFSLVSVVALSPSLSVLLSVPNKVSSPYPLSLVVPVQHYNWIRVGFTELFIMAINISVDVNNKDYTKCIWSCSEAKPTTFCLLLYANWSAWLLSGSYIWNCTTPFNLWLYILKIENETNFIVLNFDQSLYLHGAW